MADGFQLCHLHASGHLPLVRHAYRRCRSEVDRLRSLITDQNQPLELLSFEGQLHYFAHNTGIMKGDSYVYYQQN